MTRSNSGETPRQTIQQDAPASNIASQEKFFLLINERISIGKADLIYRGLTGRSDFRIDVIIPELDPQVSYPYRFEITKAKKSFRLANRYFQLISARKGALRFKVIPPQ